MVKRVKSRPDTIYNKIMLAKRVKVSLNHGYSVYLIHGRRGL